MELYQGIVLGILQGLTEFLPVSSSGHLVLGQIFFGITQSQLIFDISVHVGTLVAVLVVYFKDIMAIIASIFRYLRLLFSSEKSAYLFKEDENLRIALFILIGTIPTGLIGLFLKQFEHVLFSSQLLVGCMLILTGSILWVSKGFYSAGEKGAPLGTWRAIVIGLGQGLAVIPGISRSGTTIATGMFLGLSRDMAAKFSFLLSIPAIIGAEILGVKDLMESGASLDMVTVWSTVVSFAVGLVALKILLKLVHSGKFHLFAPYCWVLGVLALLSSII